MFRKMFIALGFRPLTEPQHAAFTQATCRRGEEFNPGDLWHPCECTADMRFCIDGQFSRGVLSASVKIEKHAFFY
jgi:hypothetical protein